MQQVVVKLPLNKPPFFGIRFPNSGVIPTVVNIDLIKEKRYQGATYKLLIELEGYKMRLKLICLEKLIIRDYVDLTVEIKDFRAWYNVARFSPIINFGHVVKDNHQDEIVRIGEKKMPVLFRVDEVQLINSVPD